MHGTNVKIIFRLTCISTVCPFFSHDCNFGFSKLDAEHNPSTLTSGSSTQQTPILMWSHLLPVLFDSRSATRTCQIHFQQQGNKHSSKFN